MMDKSESQFLMYCRIRLAHEFKIPPDDIDLEPIFSCVKRAILEGCLKGDIEEGPFLFPVTSEEKKEFFSMHGPKIIRKIFAHEPPFLDWADRYESLCIQEILKEKNKYL